MKITGIIAEYSPFHAGHLYHIQQCKKLMEPDVLVVIVSGWFSSRGLPSLISPKQKTIEALQAGADLVIELPVVFTAQAAHAFAQNAVDLLHLAGVNSLCFGSESNDLTYLYDSLEKLESLQKDPSKSMIQNGSFLQLRPNDILGVQYIKTCRKYGIEPFPILRDQSLSSATLLRKNFFSGLRHEKDEHYLPFQSWDFYYPFLRYALLMESPQNLSQCFLVSEGIENRLKKAAQSYEKWQDFLEAAISKTYTKARIQRTCLMILLHISKEDMKKHNELYGLKVLGMNEKGRALLKSLPEEIPVYTRTGQLPLFWKELDIKCANAVSLVSKKPAPKWETVII
jgi:predicted nucleotidyltransferase